MKLDNWLKKRQVFLLSLLVITGLFIGLQIVFAAAPNDTIKPSNRLVILKYQYHNAVTANTTSSWIETTGSQDHTFFMSIAGTATVTPYWSPDNGTTWFAGTAVTATAIEAYPLVDANKTRVIVSGCSACTVSVWGYHRNRE